MFPIELIDILPLFPQAIMYGLYLGTFVHCLPWLLFDDMDWNIRKKINWPMMAIAILLFILITIRLCIALQGVGPVDDVIALTLVSNWSAPVWSVTANAIRLIFDLVLVYRCWMVWDRSWRVACTPLLLWIVCLISAIMLTYYNWIFDYRWNTAYLIGDYPQLLTFTTVFYSCNIATNIYATSAIVYRIVQVTRITGNKGLRRISRILVESGAPYTLTSAIVLVANASMERNPISLDWIMVNSVAGDINMSVASIAFNLILIRVAQNREHPRHLHQTFSSFHGPRLEDTPPTVANMEQSI